MRASLLTSARALALAPTLARGHCPCRYYGQYHQPGEQRCIRGQMAIRDKDQNVPTWRTTGKDCPVSRLPSSEPQPKG